MKRFMVWTVLSMFFAMMALSLVIEFLRTPYHSEPRAPGVYARTIWDV